MVIPFVTLDSPEYGTAEQLSPLVTRVIARNPSKFSYHGTGTYIVGGGRDVIVIDPGPDLDTHRDALRSVLADRRVSTIVVTHCHADHSPLAAWMSTEYGAPTVAIGPHGEVDPTDTEIPVEEAIDVAFSPDQVVVDGDIAAAIGDATLVAVHTPGHTSNHLCAALVEERALFTGDHVMGWSTTVVAPPDGDMRAYVESLRRVAGRADRVLYPTHGAPISADPQTFVQALVDHRLERERQVIEAIDDGLATIEAIVARLYANVREELHKPAARSILAHLVKLVDDGAVTTDVPGQPRLDSTYRLR